MVWIFVDVGLSIWDNLDGVTERRATLPGPVAVLNAFRGERREGESLGASNTTNVCKTGSKTINRSLKYIQLRLFVKSRQREHRHKQYRPKHVEYPSLFGHIATRQ